MPAVGRPGGFLVVGIAVGDLPQLLRGPVDDEDMTPLITDETGTIFLIYSALHDARRRGCVGIIAFLSRGHRSYKGDGIALG